jgi:hypothetical protein
MDFAYERKKSLKTGEVKEEFLRKETGKRDE